jgi:hypothetical protein
MYLENVLKAIHIRDKLLHKLAVHFIDIKSQSLSKFLFCILLEGILLVVGLAVHVDEVAGGGDASVQVLLRFGTIRRVRQRDLKKENNIE